MNTLQAALSLPTGSRKHPVHSDAQMIETGIPWVGKSPNHWQVKRLRWTISYSRNGIWGDEPDGVNDILCVRVADFDRQSFSVSGQVPTLRCVTASDRRGRLLRKDDLLLEKSGGGELQPVGAVAIYDSNEPAVCSNFLSRLVVDTSCDARFLSYLHAHLYSARVNTRSIKQTTGIQNLDAYSYFSEKAPIPPLEEQRTIANFLDRETGKIDELIAKKETLIRTLKQSREVVASCSLTRGLNSGATFRESGYPWLGDVPEHWQVLAMKRALASVDYGISDSLKEAGSVAVLRMGNLQDGEIDLTDLRYTDAVEPALILKRNDILFNRTNSLALIGKAALFVPNDEAKVSFASYLVRFRTRQSMLPEYLCLFLNRPETLDRARSLALPAIGQANLNPNRYGYMPICVPPVAEQAAIVARIKANSRQFRNAAADVLRAIKRLTELRAALISAAVTGQIDVRNYRPETPCQ
jgi:type I restriction enzyme, S subunit